MLTVPLRSRAAAAVFLASVSAAGLLLALESVRLGIAREWTETDEIERVSQAVRLDPLNHLAHNRLGFLYLREAFDVSAALPHLRRAIELNPRIAAYWIDLGNGCELAGQMDCARESYENAVALAPMRAEFSWDLANYSLRAGDNQRALSVLARYLHFVPGAREQVFTLLNASVNDPTLVWQTVVRVSGDPEVELSYLAFLKRQSPAFATGLLWNDLTAQKKPLPAIPALVYVDRLLENQEYAEARRVWTDLQAAGAIAVNPADGNLVVNGNFEQKPLNGGLDWHFHQEPFVDFDVGQSVSCKEGHCLYLNFSVPHNAEYEPAYQIVPVKPKQSYVLSAFIRTQDITSDSGPRLRVVDPQCPDCLDVTTSSAFGTTPWHRLELPFATGPKTQAVRLSVWRARSRVFPMEISGEFWLDSVAIKPAGEPVAEAQ